MTQLLKLLQNLNENNIQFKLEEIDEVTGDVSITTADNYYYTSNSQNEVLEKVGNEVFEVKIFSCLCGES